MLEFVIGTQLLLCISRYGCYYNKWLVVLTDYIKYSSLSVELMV